MTQFHQENNTATKKLLPLSMTWALTISHSLVETSVAPSCINNYEQRKNCDSPFPKIVWDFKFVNGTYSFSMLWALLKSFSFHSPPLSNCYFFNQWKEVGRGSGFVFLTDIVQLPIFKLNLCCAHMQWKCSWEKTNWTSEEEKVLHLLTGIVSITGPVLLYLGQNGWPSLIIYSELYQPLLRENVRTSIY